MKTQLHRTPRPVRPVGSSSLSRAVLETLERRALMSTGGIVGALDTSLGNNGVLNVGALPADGSPLVGAFLDRNPLYVRLKDAAGHRSIALTRYTPSGSIFVEPPEGSAVYGPSDRLLDIGADIDELGGLALQPNRKPVVVGSTGGDLLLARFSYQNVRPDETFGLPAAAAGQRRGYVTFDFPNASFTSGGVTFQKDDKLVVTGRLVPDGQSAGDVAILRFNADGSLDTTFNAAGPTPGLRTLDLGGNDAPRDVAYDYRDGALYVGGVSRSAGGSSLALVRLTPAGVPDANFAGDGIATLPVAPDAAADALGTALLPDGRIVVGAQIGADHAAIVRFTRAGVPDATFGGTGLVTTTVAFDINGAGTFHDLAVQNDGSVIIAGSVVANPLAANPANDTAWAVLRLTPAGAADASFGPGGRALTNVTPNATDALLDVGLQENGDILTLGRTANGQNVAIARYTSQPPTRVPFFGAPAAVPGRVQMEDYDFGGQNVAYTDTSPMANLGKNPLTPAPDVGKYRLGGVDLEQNGGNPTPYLGYTKLGEWVDYTISIPAAGYHRFTTHYAANATTPTQFDLTFLDPATGATVASTGPRTITGNDFSVYKDDVAQTYLPAGTLVMRLRMLTDSTKVNGNDTRYSQNFDYIDIAPIPAPPRAPYPGPAAATVPGAVQAENYDSGDPGVAYLDTTPANEGGKYRTSEAVDVQSTTDAGAGFNLGWTRAGEWLEYTVDVATADTYKLEARVASAGAGGTFHVELNGQNISGAVAVPNTGGWQTWATVAKTGLALPAGRQVLRVVFDSVGATGLVGNINWFKFSQVATPPPPATQSPFKGVPFNVGDAIQAEDFDKGGEAVAFHDVDAKNLGGQYRTAEAVDIEASKDAGAGHNLAYTKAGEWLEYTVNVPAAGTYRLDLRVANAAAGGVVHAEFGGVNKTGALAIPNTGGYQAWTTIAKTVQLDAGQQVLRLALDATAANGFVGNINWLMLSLPSQPPPGPSAVRVQAEDFVSFRDTDAVNSGGKYRSTGVDIETTTDAGGGFNVGYVKATEWLQYDVTLAAAATYALDLRLAAGSAGGALHVELDGVRGQGTIAVPSTGGWQTWTTITGPSLNLGTGKHTLRIVFDTAGSSGFVANVNWLEVRPV